MLQIPKDLVLQRLVQDNPWWSKDVPDLPFSDLIPRPYIELFYPQLTQRKPRRALVLMGPRRVGKTVLIHHAVHRLLKDGIPPKHICYVSIDNPIYLHKSLEQLLGLFEEATGVNYINTPVFVFFDEIQYLRSWESHLKSLVDTQNQIKCVASGSAAAALKLKSDESGAGRFTDFLLPPLTFYEYLSLTGGADLFRIDGEGASREAIPRDLTEANEKFVDYLNFGGYPEVALSKTVQSDPGRYIKSDIIDKVLLRDLPSMYGIEDIQELNSLFTALAFNTAEEISLEGLSKNSGVAKHTIKRYIEYLKAAFLIRTVSRVDRDAATFQRARNFKVYLANPSMRTALFAGVKEGEEIGSVVETGIFAQWFHSRATLHYARWKKGEIDIVYLKPNRQVAWALEVKWSDSYPDQLQKLDEQIGFCRLHKINNLRVTTKTRTEVRERLGVRVDFVPAASHCYILGYNILSQNVTPLDSSSTGSDQQRVRPQTSRKPLGEQSSLFPS